jgi:hypothetical protein
LKLAMNENMNFWCFSIKVQLTKFEHKVEPAEVFIFKVLHAYMAKTRNQLCFFMSGLSKIIIFYQLVPGLFVYTK